MRRQPLKSTRDSRPVRFRIGTALRPAKSADPLVSPVTFPRGRISTQFRILLAGGVGRQRARVAREHVKRGLDRLGEFSQTLGQLCATGRAAAPSGWRDRSNAWASSLSASAARRAGALARARRSCLPRVADQGRPAGRGCDDRSGPLGVGLCLSIIRTSGLCGIGAARAPLARESGRPQVRIIRALLGRR